MNTANNAQKGTKDRIPADLLEQGGGSARDRFSDLFVSFSAISRVDWKVLTVKLWIILEYVHARTVTKTAALG